MKATLPCGKKLDFFLHELCYPSEHKNEQSLSFEDPCFFGKPVFSFFIPWLECHRDGVMTWESVLEKVESFLLEASFPLQFENLFSGRDEVLEILHPLIFHVLEGVNFDFRYQFMSNIAKLIES